MARDTEWYRRMGDIRGLESYSSPGVDRSKLRGHDKTPEVHVFEFEGERRETLWWPTEDGGTSGSPANEHLRDQDEERTASDVMKRLAEALELPGQPADYHFAIQSAASVLHDRRRAEPGVLLNVEQLCWLDIQLVEACPRAVSYESADGETYYSITAFYTLISMYKREGFIREALAVVERAKPFGRQVPGEREDLETRLTAIEAEEHR